MSSHTERSQFMAGYAAGKLNELERLYNTIDSLLLQACHNKIPQEEFDIIEKTLIAVKNYMPKVKK